MLSKRRSTRPLGHVVQESRLELQVEKALFKTNMRLLSDLIATGRRPHSYHEPAYYDQRRANQPRLFMTRSERLRKVNDADYQAKFTTQTPERVVSADRTRLDVSRLLQYQTSICDRHYRRDSAKIKHAQCDVLGPYYCTDCIKLKKRNTNYKTHQRNFPNIEVHPRSLVAPDKVDRVLMSRESILLNNIGNNHSNNTEFSHTPSGYNESVYLPVLTENDVVERIRRDKSTNTTPRTPRSPINSYRNLREISGAGYNPPPSPEMKVSVTFSNGWVT